MAGREVLIPRWMLWLIVALAVMALGLGTAEPTAAADGANSTIPSIAPALHNPSFECSEGYAPATNSAGETVFVPSGWTLVRADGGPLVHSARIHFEQRADPGGGCFTDNVKSLEKFDGRDSFFVEARDLETPSEPGKKFDVVIRQQTPVVPGAAYSLSGWMLSLCGGSAMPCSCPPGNYIVKALGLDPMGGSDPASDTIVWAESRNNFVTLEQERVGWNNVQVAARAQSTQMTVFVRMESPFQWHGNHGFIDALSLVRAPVAWFEGLPAEVRNTRRIELKWTSLQTPDAALIPGGTYELLTDIQVRLLPDGVWRDVAVGLTDQRALAYYAPCSEHTYEFRIRARAEQPEGSHGVSPNQRYIGVWSDSIGVRFVQDAAAPASMPLPGDLYLFLPRVCNQVEC